MDLGIYAYKQKSYFILELSCDFISQCTIFYNKVF